MAVTDPHHSIRTPRPAGDPAPPATLRPRQAPSPDQAGRQDPNTQEARRWGAGGHQPEGMGGARGRREPL